MDEALGGHPARLLRSRERCVHRARATVCCGNDGELASVIGAQVATARQTFDTLFSEHLGEDSDLRRMLSPDEGNALLEAMRGQLARALQVQSDAITRPSSRSIVPMSALSRPWCGS